LLIFFESSTFHSINISGVLERRGKLEPIQRRPKWQKVTVEKVEAKAVVVVRQAILAKGVIGHLLQASHQEAAGVMVHQRANDH